MYNGKTSRVVRYQTIRSSNNELFLQSSSVIFAAAHFSSLLSSLTSSLILPYPNNIQNEYDASKFITSRCKGCRVTEPTLATRFTQSSYVNNMSIGMHADTYNSNTGYTRSNLPANLAVASEALYSTLSITADSTIGLWRAV